MNFKRFFISLSAFSLALAILVGLIFLFSSQKKEVYFSKKENQVSRESNQPLFSGSKKTGNENPISKINEFFGGLKNKEEKVNTQKKKEPNIISGNKNYTETFAHLIFQKNLSNGQLPEGDSINTSGAQEEVAKLRDKFLSEREIIKADDLNITEDNSTSSIVRFGNIFYQLLSQSGPLSTTTEEAFDKFVKEKDASGFLKAKEEDEEIIDYSKKILVPSNYQGFFLDYSNAISLEEEIFSALANYEKDPLKAIIAFKLLPEVDKKIAQIAIACKNKLETDLKEEATSR